MDGIFAFDEFFKAAQAANLYVIVRPGPYVAFLDSPEYKDEETH